MAIANRREPPASLGLPNPGAHFRMTYVLSVNPTNEVHQIRRRYGGDRVRRISLMLILLVVVASSSQAESAADQVTPPPGRMAFIRDGNLWVWQAGNERQVTKEKKDSAPHFSASGQYIAFTRNRELWVAQAEGERQWRVSETVGSGEWSPKEDTLAFSTEAGTSTVSITATGPMEAKLLAAGWSGAAWSPDGQQLAVVKNTPGEKPFGGTTAIGLVSRSGGEPRVTMQTTYPHQSACGPVGGATQLRWSADGQWIAFFRCGLFASLSADCNELAVLPAEGGQPTAVGVVPANPAWFAWAPSGAVLAFTDGSGRDAWTNKAVRVAVMPPAPPYYSLTPAGHADREPAWSTDGKRLAFTRSLAEWPDRTNLPAPGQVIWVAKAPRGHAAPVPGSEHGFSPRWGPGDSLVWFRGVGGEKGNLWYVKQPGQRKQQVIEGIDLPFPYYGQWQADLVFDWWIREK